jgi:hypothetical protein
VKRMERRSKLMALMCGHQRVAQMMIDVARGHNIARLRVCIDLVAQSTRAFDCSRSCPHD